MKAKKSMDTAKDLEDKSIQQQQNITKFTIFRL